MHIPQFIRLAALSAVALAGFTVAAQAAMGPAVTNTSANLRSGPGTSYGVIHALPPGYDVEVNACTLVWCAVDTNDYGEGFIAKSLLDFDGGPIVVTPPDDEDNGDDSSPPPSGTAEVCFYQQQNLHGANFCVYPGDEDSDIPGNFDDNIASILIEGDASVEVCTDVDHGGECKTYYHTVKKLPSYLRDDISSYTVGDSSNDPGDDGDGSGDDPGDNGNVIVLQ